jgi:hypothetical protein
MFGRALVARRNGRIAIEQVLHAREQLDVLVASIDESARRC